MTPEVSNFFLVDSSPLLKLLAIPPTPFTLVLQLEVCVYPSVRIGDMKER
jgi:hypothetical protein